MQTLQGKGCWPGQAEGRIVWAGFSGAGGGPAAGGPGDPLAPEERAAEVLRFRAAVGAALADLERWLEQQPTVESRLLVQSYRDAVHEDAWTRRACALIDGQGLTAPAAAREAAETVAAVLDQTEEFRGRAEAMRTAARWLAGRLAGPPPAWPAGTIVVAADLTPLELLDLGHPAIIGGNGPLVVGETPLVWGVPHLGPHWEGRLVAIDGPTLTLDLPDGRWWHLDGDRLGGCLVCYLNGDLEVLERMTRKTGEPPVAMVSRLDDLAAVPLFLHATVAVAVDLDRMGPAPRLKHPGVQLLFKTAAAAAREAGIPLLAGGEPVEKHPDVWLALGFPALFTRSPARGGLQRALRRNAPGGM